MKRQLRSMAVVLAALAWSAPVFANDEMQSPSYSSVEARRIINRMIEAHGGMKGFEKATSISYDFIMYLPIMEQMSEGEVTGWDLWRVAHTAIEPKSWHGYTDLPWEGATIASDGDTIWSVDYKDGNPPIWRLWHHFSYVTLPWLTQDPRVMLQGPTTAKLPNDATEYHLIKMTVKGQESEGTPSRYTTTDVSGERVFGLHLVLNHSTSLRLDRSKTEMPEGAVVGGMLVN